MIFIFDGQQGVGKSTLIEALAKENSGEILKFPFSLYSKDFSLQQGNGLKGFQIGKDLAFLYWLMNLPIETKDRLYYVDRGPLSTLFYSIRYGRLNSTEINKFAKILGDFKNDQVKFVFITCRNRRGYERRKGDGFDELDSTDVNKIGDLRAYLALQEVAKRANLEFISFENDFDDPIEKNVIRLKREILNGG